LFFDAGWFDERPVKQPSFCFSAIC